MGYRRDLTDWLEKMFCPDDFPDAPTYADMLISALEQAGWRIVPLELTEHMLEEWKWSAPKSTSGMTVDDADRAIARADWAAFLAARPQDPKE